MEQPTRATFQKKRLGDFLVENGLVEPEALKAALEEKQRSGGKLGEVLVRLGLVSEQQLMQVLAVQLGYHAVDLKTVSFDPEAVLSISEHLARRHQVIPVRFEGRTLVVAMSDPLDYECMRDLSFYSGYGVRPMLASRQDILSAIDQQYKFYRGGISVETLVQESARDLGGDRDIEVIPEIKGSGEEVRSLEEKSQLAPIIRLANTILSRGIKIGASDLHIEPGARDCRVRYRTDGLLRDEMRLPRWVQGALVSRIKVLANVDIAERRQPQDGAVRIRVDGREIDLRVSVLPVQHGEKVVIRVLDQARLPVDFQSLGLSAGQLDQLLRLLRRKKGMLLVTGPTGSGKTTTLYALINRLKGETTNLMTVEDPIEYSIDGVNQTQVNPDIGLTFARCLRAILRQDPNVILVGEIRDLETAQIAFRAAMTGHLVLSTLHTNDAPSTVSRLIEMGIPRYLVGSQLIGVIAQRLVRCLCTRCKTAVPVRPEDLIALGLPAGTFETGQVFEPGGCTYCHDSGYTGRTGLFEIMELTAEIRELIAGGAPEQSIRAAALAGGMGSLFQSGVEKLRSGVISLTELVRVIETEDHLETFCSGCGRAVTIDFSACPYCARPTLYRCPGCQRSRRPDWVICPYCRLAFDHAG